MDTRDLYKLIRGMEENHESEDIKLHDSFDLELNENFVIETGVVGFTEDGGVILHLDEDALEFLGFHGILNESEQFDEYMKLGGGGDAAEGGTRVMGEGIENWGPVGNAVANRIMRQHPDALGKYGLDAVMDAIEDVDSYVGDVEEIGSSDVSIWVRDVLDSLSRNSERQQSKDDGWDPNIDDRDQIDELSAIKRLAHGEQEVDEGLGKMLLGGAALIAAIAGVNKYEANQMMKNDPQLAKLAHFREVAQQKGDDSKVQELDDRIKQTLDHLNVTGDEVRDQSGNPVDPQYESVEMDEAEYHGRKVPLGKPMQGDVKKSKVYVRKPNGKVVKVNFGDKNMRIKKNSPGHRKSFRARHHCENPGPRWKARYWSCRAW
jgi:hypothetical protein